MVAPTFNLTVMRPLPATVNASTGVTNASNVLNPQPGVKAAVGAASFVVLDLGSNQNINQFFIGYTGGLTSVRVRASLISDGITAPVIDQYAYASPAGYEWANRPVGYRDHMWWQQATVLARYVRLDFSTAVDVGIVAVGKAVQPEYNADYGDTSWGYVEPDEGDFLDSGVEVLIERTPAPYFEFRLTWLTELEMKTDWEPLSRAAIEGVPVVVCRDPSGIHTVPFWQQGLYYGRLRLSPLVAADFDMYEVNGKIRSMV